MSPETLDLAQSDTILGMPNKEFLAFAKTLVIAIPTRQSGGSKSNWPNLYKNQRIWAVLDTNAELFLDSFEGFVDVFRGNMAANFLRFCSEPGNEMVDKLVMIDDDEALDWSAPFKLAMWDLPIVSGVVCSRSQQRGVYACFTVKDEYGVPRFPSERYTKRLPAKGLINAHSVGGGLVCVKKQVFQDIIDSGEMPFEIPQQDRRDSMKTGLLKYGEDIAFCRQARALGHEIYVDLSVHAQHHKIEIIQWPKNKLADDLAPSEFKVDMRDYFHG